MELIDGKKVAEEIKQEVKDKVAELAGGGRPSITLVQVGEDPASSAYVKTKVRMSEFCGIESRHLHLPEDVTEEKLLTILRELGDDPNVNGTADPEVAGDEDPTRVTIVSAPLFVVQKISTDLTGDPAVLLAGETLLYTLTLRNIGNEDAVSVMLRDAVPVNTTYVASSSTLNGTRSS